METDETKSVQQPQSPTRKQTDSKTSATAQFGGISPLPQRSSNSGDRPQPDLWTGLRLPLKRTGTIVIIILILALLASGLFNLAKGAMESLTVDLLRE